MNAKTWYEGGQYKEVNNLNVFFTKSGQGVDLICIHGFPSSSWDFEKIWPGLTNRFKVMAHDLIGLGRSAKPDQPLSVSLQADIIEGLVLQEGMNKLEFIKPKDFYINGNKVNIK